MFDGNGLIFLPFESTPYLPDFEDDLLDSFRARVKPSWASLLFRAHPPPSSTTRVLPAVAITVPSNIYILIPLFREMISLTLMVQFFF